MDHEKKLYFREILVELLATFTINYISSYARISANLLPSNLSPSILYFFPNMLFTTAFILLTFPKARCHFTPILTLSSIVFQGLHIKQGLLIMFSQFIGCLFSSAMLVLTLTSTQIDILSKNRSYLGFPTLNKTAFSSINGFFGELIFTSLLVYVFLYYSQNKVSGKYWKEFYAIIRGVVILISAFATEYVCSASINPFPVITGALISTNLLQYQWYFMVPPLIGIIIGGLLYKNQSVENFFRIVKKEHDN